MLQWGRVRVNAEGFYGGYQALYPEALQWGRVRVNAEGRTDWREIAQQLPASMGPRSCERGRLHGADGGEAKRRASMGPRSCERGRQAP